MTESTLADQLAWVRAVMVHLGNISANELAKRAGFNPSTLQRPLNDPNYAGALSGQTLSKIGAAAGLRPFEYPNRAGGLAEPEAVRFVYDQSPDIIEANIDRAVRELCKGRNGRDPWVIQGFALELCGLLPGDVLVVDMNLTPKPGDVVCAQVYEWSHMKAETVFRIYQPPYLMTSSVRYGVQKPLLVDDHKVIIRGVVDGVFRQRRPAA